MSVVFGSMRPLVVLLCLWVLMHTTYVQSFSSKLQQKRTVASVTSLYAKKSKSSSKSSVSEKSNKKGFGSTDPSTLPMKSLSREPEAESTLEDQNIGYTQKTNNPRRESKNELRKTKEMDPAEMDRLFQKYGLNEKSNSSSNKSKRELQQKKARGELSFGEEVLARIPEDFQTKLDNGLIVATFLALSFVVLCGIGISLGAYKVAFPSTEIPPDLDNIVKNVLSPSFTPALGVFFFFSITLGLFKFAQISSDRTVYREQE